MMLPQEVEVWYILPAIRSALCKELASKLSQKDIAKLLGITEPAVSQYIKGKRGSKIKFNEQTKADIKKIAEKLAAKEIHPLGALNYLSKKILMTNVMCQVHMQLDKETPDNCRVCFDKV
ncbi:MAG: helix-turn-helix domain-containing protein [DPANN group archaeon]|nr:helix-turn-helix domain-containing protein [DPANN group archaeon]